jgi:hypothetical protein
MKRSHYIVIAVLLIALACVCWAAYDDDEPAVHTFISGNFR